MWRALLRTSHDPGPALAPAGSRDGAKRRTRKDRQGGSSSAGFAIGSTPCMRDQLKKAPGVMASEERPPCSGPRPGQDAAPLAVPATAARVGDPPHRHASAGLAMLNATGEGT
jgi:hypothetical protein